MTQPLTLVLASNNAKKLAELQALFGALALTLVPQGVLGIAEADEPHISFVENALAKARHAAAATGCAAIADDSGLCIEALDGAPGVISAHFAPAPPEIAGTDREARRRAQDAANNALLLERLAGVAERGAYFVSTLVALRHAADPQPLVATARWRGEILSAPRGAGGFGYDPLLYVPEAGCTVAEMGTAQKNRLSHRAQAAALMRALLADVWRL